MKKKFLLTALLSLLVVFAFACGSGGSPADVAKSFYKAGNDGDYAKAESYIYSGARMAQSYMGSLGMATDFKSYIDKCTRNGEIAQIEITDGTTVSGSSAAVSVILHYTDGDQQTYLLGFLKEDGKWKIYTY